MTDVVFFAGPIIVKPAFQNIDWFGRQVAIVPIAGAGSSHFSALAEELRAADGRILPNLIARYAKGLSVDKLALAAYSAGHGLLNKIADNDRDRQDVDAMVLSDATFNAFNTGAKRGYVKFGIDAAKGRRLMVSTTANTTDGTHMTGRDSFRLVWDAVMQNTGKRDKVVDPRAPAPLANGGWHKIGSLLYWGDYYSSTHGEQHDLGAAIWQAYLAPYFAGRLTPWWPWALAGLLGGTGSALIWKGLSKR